MEAMFSRVQHLFEEICTTTNTPLYLVLDAWEHSKARGQLENEAYSDSYELLLFDESFARLSRFLGRLAVRQQISSSVILVDRTGVTARTNTSRDLDGVSTEPLYHCFHSHRYQFWSDRLGLSEEAIGRHSCAHVMFVVFQHVPRQRFD